ncbi:MAG: hypothetical protein JO264_09035 [Acidisphaera sp.]|nr:hypothetical protein [Acidisphaera sp.]
MNCYRFLLDREPETEQVVEDKCRASSLDLLIDDMVSSSEFLEAHKVAIAQILRERGK